MPSFLNNDVSQDISYTDVGQNQTKPGSLNVLGSSLESGLVNTISGRIIGDIYSNNSPSDNYLSLDEAKSSPDYRSGINLNLLKNSNGLIPSNRLQYAAFVHDTRQKADETYAQSSPSIINWAAGQAGNIAGWASDPINLVGGELANAVIGKAASPLLEKAAFANPTLNFTANRIVGAGIGATEGATAMAPQAAIDQITDPGIGENPSFAAFLNDIQNGALGGAAIRGIFGTRDIAKPNDLADTANIAINQAAQGKAVNIDVPIKNAVYKAYNEAYKNATEMSQFEHEVPSIHNPELTIISKQHPFFTGESDGLFEPIDFSKENELIDNAPDEQLSYSEKKVASYFDEASEALGSLGKNINKNLFSEIKNSIPDENFYESAINKLDNAQSSLYRATIDLENSSGSASEKAKLSYKIKKFADSLEATKSIFNEKEISQLSEQIVGQKIRENFDQINDFHNELKEISEKRNKFVKSQLKDDLKRANKIGAGDSVKKILSEYNIKLKLPDIAHYVHYGLKNEEIIQRHDTSGADPVSYDQLGSAYRQSFSPLSDITYDNKVEAEFYKDMSDDNFKDHLELENEFNQRYEPNEEEKAEIDRLNKKSEFIKKMADAYDHIRNCIAGIK